MSQQTQLLYFLCANAFTVPTILHHHSKNNWSKLITLPWVSNKIKYNIHWLLETLKCHKIPSLPTQVQGHITQKTAHHAASKLCGKHQNFTLITWPKFHCNPFKTVDQLCSTNFLTWTNQLYGDFCTIYPSNFIWTHKTTHFIPF